MRTANAISNFNRRDLSDRIGRVLLLLFAVCVLEGCADLESRAIDDIDDTDYWDSALVFVQNVSGISDLASLAILLLIASGYFAGRRAGVKLFVGAIRNRRSAGPAE